MAAMAHGLGGQIALVHAFGAILARSASVFVDTFGLALATAHTGATGSKGRRADSRHFWGFWIRCEMELSRGRDDNYATRCDALR